MSEPLYNRDILRLAVSIPNEQRLVNSDGTAECRSKTCGSRVIADVKLTADFNIAELGLEINACALGQASAAILGKEAIGKSRTEIEAVRSQFLAFLESQSDSPGKWDNMHLLKAVREHKGRHAAVLLPYDAVLAAIEAALINRKAA